MNNQYIMTKEGEYMDMNNINAISAYKSVSDAAKINNSTSEDKRTLKQTDDYTLVAESPAAVYEKSDLVEMLKADSEARVNSLKNMVAEAMKTQIGIATGNDDDSIWKFLASGDYTVTAAAKEKAKELISEDGYFGVEKTSDRIVEFAKALSGGDASKADELLNAFKKGFDEATKSWGKELPDISKKTYDKVLEKFDKWKNENNTSTPAADTTVTE